MRWITVTNVEVLPSDFQGSQSTSLTHCAMMCLGDPACGGICFNHQSKSCYKLMDRNFEFTSRSDYNNEACVRYGQSPNSHKEGMLYVFQIANSKKLDIIFLFYFSWVASQWSLVRNKVHDLAVRIKCKSQLYTPQKVLRIEI